MKKLTTLSAILVLGLVIFTGCSKKSDSPSYFMKATIGGTAYNANYCSAANGGGVMTVITGLNASGSVATPPYVNLVLTGYNKTTGTFAVGDQSTSNYAGYYKDATTIYVSTSGTINITSANSSAIVGTFSFTAVNAAGTDSIKVTDGKFTAKGY